MVACWYDFREHVLLFTVRNTNWRQLHEVTFSVFVLSYSFLRVNPLQGFWEFFKQPTKVKTISILHTFTMWNCHKTSKYFSLSGFYVCCLFGWQLIFITPSFIHCLITRNLFLHKKVSHQRRVINALNHINVVKWF